MENSNKSLPENDRPILPTGDTGAPADIFSNLNALRLSQDFASAVGVKRALLTIPVKKPTREWWIRVHPQNRLETAVLELKEDREVYLVAPPLWQALSTEVTFSPRLLVQAITRQNVVFIWPLVLPGPDGKTMDWYTSALEAASMAQSRWVRVVANMSLGAYEVFEATGDLPDPTWPETSFEEILRVAFKGRVIDTPEHPVLKRLRGEA
jgi:hypothetical protein